MGEGEGIKLCADDVSWNWKNEGGKAIGGKRLCCPESRLYLFPLLLLLLKKKFIIFCGASVPFMLIVNV